MLAELQGRLPIRVELKGLTREVRFCAVFFRMNRCFECIDVLNALFF